MYAFRLVSITQWEKRTPTVLRRANILERVWNSSSFIHRPTRRRRRSELHHCMQGGCSKKKKKFQFVCVRYLKEEDDRQKDNDVALNVPSSNRMTNELIDKKTLASTCFFFNCLFFLLFFSRLVSR